MEKKNNYWKERMLSQEDRQYQKSQKYYEDVQKQYQLAVNNIQMDIEHWYIRLAENNDISYAAAQKFLNKSELEEFRWTAEQYIMTGRKNAVSEMWKKQLENASARYHISYLEVMKMQIQQHAELLSTKFEGGITEFLHNSFTEQFYRTAFETIGGKDIGINLTKWDDEKVDTIIRTPWAQDEKNFSDRIWDNKRKLLQNLHTSLTQCLIRGDSPDKAAINLSKIMEVSKGQARTLIMTESAAISSVAQQKCFIELDVQEFEVVETLDSHTCEICQLLDGMHFPMKDFEIGITAPPFHPRCRGCTCPYFYDEFVENEERTARNPATGKTEYIPSKMTYKEWYDKYVVDDGYERKYTMGIRLPDPAGKIKGFSAEVRMQIDNSIQKIQNQYNIKIDSITTESIGKGDIFITGYYEGKMGLVINSAADFEHIIKRIPKRYASGFFAGKSLDDYIAHEMFHIMTYQDCTSDKMYMDRYQNIESLYGELVGISGYADKSESGNEALAEAFVRMRNNEQVPELAKVLVELYSGRWKK